MSLPVVALFATGGTIASRSSAAVGADSVPSLAAKDLLEMVPEHRGMAIVNPVDFSRVISQEMTPTMLVTLCQQLNQTLADDRVTGAVITHGTGTLEDTCFLVDLLVRSDKPVIATGAMFTASNRGWDGRRNIIDSLIAAVASESVGKGVMLCMNGELHSARDVLKVHPSSPGAFLSPGGGPLGTIDEGRVMYHYSRTRRYTFPREAIDSRVEVVKIVQGSDDRLLRAAIGFGIRGVVLEGLCGRGATPSWYLPAVREAVDRGIAIVLCGKGPIAQVAFTVDTFMTQLHEIGVISGGDLPANKARLLLMAALAHTQDVDEIRTIFASYAP